MHIELICKYHDVISKSKFGLGSAKIFERKIELKDEAPAYIKKESLIKEWLKIGIIELSRSMNNSPKFMVLKKDRSLHAVQDFGQLNSRNHNYHHSINDSTIFCTLDLISGF